MDPGRLTGNNNRIPLHLARRPGPAERFLGCGDERVLAERLEELLRALDRMLDDPIRIERSEEFDSVWVFEHLGYRVSRRDRAVWGMRRVAGRAVPESWVLELLRPLATSAFAVEVLRKLGLSDLGRQLRLFPSQREIAAQEQWLADAAYALLRRDARFVQLRTQLLPQALELDPELVAIALRARPVKTLGHLTSLVFNRVWCHESVFRQVARENPQLLPLVYVALAEDALEPSADPVRALHDCLRATGLGEAAWRYLAKHGARFLRPAWEVAQNDSRLEVALHYLRVLEAAGLPPPPPASVLERISLPAQDTGRVRFRRGWCRVPAAVLGLALGQADRVRPSHEFEGYLEELRVVARWARHTRPALNKQQRRAGWRPLVRRALEWERADSAVDARSPRRWRSAVGEFCAGRYRVVPLDNVRALLDESLALRNCAASMVGDCQLGSTRLFSVRDNQTGKRLAMIGLRQGAAPPWQVLDVKGPANRPAPRNVERLAEDLAQMYALSEGSIGHGDQGRYPTIEELFAPLRPEELGEEDDSSPQRICVLLCGPGLAPFGAEAG